MKIASGGELARFLLALKVALADRGSAPTLVFDEIDTAVGGAVADAIGVRLARLAGGVQVLSVTHAPQVAARAGAHLLVAKDRKGRATVTGVTRLDDGAPARGDRPHARRRDHHRRGARRRRPADPRRGVNRVQAFCCQSCRRPPLTRNIILAHPAHEGRRPEAVHRWSGERRFTGFAGRRGEARVRTAVTPDGRLEGQTRPLRGPVMSAEPGS